MHALACLVLDFTLFTFYPTFNVLSKRQSRNLSANTAINDIFQSTPDHSYVPYYHYPLLLSTSNFALHRIAVHCRALHSLSTREEEALSPQRPRLRFAVLP